jgi:hypothetical protein
VALRVIFYPCSKLRPVLKLEALHSIHRSTLQK